MYNTKHRYKIGGPFMFSFVVNTVAVIVGSLIGILFKSKIKKEICDKNVK